MFLIIVLAMEMIKPISSQDIKLGLPLGHGARISSLQFSPDGKKVVSGSWDQTIKIWDVESGKLLHDLSSDTKQVVSAQFSPDGKRLLTISLGSSIVKIWDAIQGKLLYNLESHKSYVVFARFNPSGTQVISTSNDMTAKLWDATNGDLLRQFKGHTGGITSAFFNPEGTKIITASWDNTAKIWDVESANLLHDLNLHTQKVTSAEFSPDGSKAVTASGDGTIIIWNVTTGNVLLNIRPDSTVWINGAFFNPDGGTIAATFWDGTVKIWDAINGNLLQVLKGQFNRNVHAAQFSPDGTTILSLAVEAKLWDTRGGKLLHELERFHGSVISAGFSPDGRMIGTGDVDGIIKIFNANTGIVIRELGGQTRWVPCVDFSLDSKKLAISYDDGTVGIWDVGRGYLLQDFRGHSKPVWLAKFDREGRSLLTGSFKEATIWDEESGNRISHLVGNTDYVLRADFSPDNQRVVTSCANGMACIWNRESGDKLVQFEGQSGWTSTIQFNSDGKRVVTASDDGTIKIWDAINGQLIHDFKSHVGIANDAQFSPDGSKIVYTYYEKAILCDAESGQVLHELVGHNDWVVSVCFSPDGKSVITGSYDKTAKVWDVQSGKMVHDLLGHSDWVHIVLFTSEGEQIVTTSFDGTCKIWNAAEGNLKYELKGHVGGIFSVVSPDGHFVATVSHVEHKVNIWNLWTGELLYSRLQLKEGEWLTYDKYNRYDGSPAARDYLYFVCGDEIIDLAQMKDALYVPGLVEKIMTGQDINYPKLADLDICGTLPLVEPIDNADATYAYKVIPRKLGLDYVEVYVNDKRILQIPRSELIRKDDYYLLRLDSQQISRTFIIGIYNEIKVIGVTHDGESELRSRGAVIVEASEKKTNIKPRLFALMVGVNDYKDDLLDLYFPVKDAIDLGHSLELSAKKLLGEENVYLYQVHSQSENEKTYTTPEKEGVRKALEDIGKKARPEDVVLIFFAGHGVMQGVDEKVFTFLTADATLLNPIGISTKDLQSWLSFDGPHKMLANKTILILDACNSGQVTQELMALARTDDDSRKIRQIEDLKDKSGMFILAASAPNQSAYELPEYEQGLLTYSLLHTLKNNPDVLDDDRFLNVQKWFLESEKYLQQLVASLGYEQNAQPFGTANIRIGEVDEAVRRSINLAEEKPVVVCANVMNEATFNDDLRLKNMINGKLSEISERGTQKTIVYPRQETEQANKINIRYKVNGDDVTCDVRVIKNDEQIHGVILTGRKSDLGTLLDRVIDEVVKYVK